VMRKPSAAVVAKPGEVAAKPVAVAAKPAKPVEVAAKPDKPADAASSDRPTAIMNTVLRDQVKARHFKRMYDMQCLKPAIKKLYDEAVYVFSRRDTFFSLFEIFIWFLVQSAVSKTCGTRYNVICHLPGVKQSCPT